MKVGNLNEYNNITPREITNFGMLCWTNYLPRFPLLIKSHIKDRLKRKLVAKRQGKKHNMWLKKRSVSVISMSASMTSARSLYKARNF